MVSSDTESQIQFSKGTEVEVTSDEEGFRGAWYLATILESPPKSASKKRKKALIEYKYLVTEDGSGPLTEYIDPAYIRPLPPQQEGGEDVFELNEVVEANYRDGWWTGTVRKVLDNGKFRVCFDNPPDVIDFEAIDLRVHYQWVNGKWVRPEKEQSTGSIFSPGTAVEVNLDNKESLRDVWFPAIVIKENVDGTFFVKYQNSKNSEEAATVKVTLDSQHIRPPPPRYVDRNYELLEKVDTSYGFGWRAGVITKVLAGRSGLIFFQEEGNDAPPFAVYMWSRDQEILVTSDYQEQLEHAHNDSNNPEVAQRLESSGSVKDKSEEQTACLTNVKNQMEDQSTPMHEDSAAYALSPSKKKIKVTSSNGTAERSRPIKQLTEGNAADAPASHLRKTQNETAKESHVGLATTKTDRTGTRCSKKSVSVEQPSAKPESPILGKRIKIKQQKFGVDFETEDIVKRRGRPSKLQNKSSPTSVAGKEMTSTLAAAELNENDGKNKEVEVPVILGLEAKGIEGAMAQSTYKISDEVSLKLIKDQKKNLNDSGGDSPMAKGGGSSQRRKRGRPRKLVVLSPRAPEDGKEHKGEVGALHEVVVKDHTNKDADFPSIKRLESTVRQDALGAKTADISEVDCTTKEIDMAIAVASNNMADDDQPLSTWIGGMHSSSVEELRLSSGRTVNGLNEAKEKQIDVIMKCSEIDAKGSSDAVENPVLPFVKKSPIWTTIESFDAFQIMPQKPHFHPLSETKEEYREGSAVGIMVTYAGLFEKITMMQFDDSRSVFDRTLESLLDLERHGFDVTMLRGRVNELLSIRDGQGRLVDELKVAEKEMTERTKVKNELGKEIEEIKKKINELEEQLDSTKLRKQTQENEVARLQSNVEDIKKRVQMGRNDFEKVASASWKIS
ncbi:DUF724 domain-containing protein 7 [Citrus sinensis]|uniref:DUF724 domain-containing protein 7 n=1 Tax=Citrus sinensis TaxID=2711 RepID=A0ACB8MMS8_CITSI|nr:DUF724 domain-containing protein 7 [Citrus sinensis]